MGEVRDRWMQPGQNGRKVRNERWGKGSRWQARWYDDTGGRHSKTFVTKDAAQLHLRKVDGEPVLEDAKVTFGEVARQWLDSQLHQRPQTREAAERTLRNAILPELGDLLLDRVTRADVQTAVASWSQRYAPSKVHVTYGYVATIYRHAVDDRLVRFSPCSRISLPPVERQSLVPLTQAQVSEIAGRVPDHYRHMVILTASTGLRSGEVRGLTTDRVQSGARLLRVDRQLLRSDRGQPVFGPPKSSAGVRTLELGTIARQAITEHLDQYGPGRDGLLFTGRLGTPITRGDAGEVWRRATAEMGLRRRSGWHDLRHYCASLLISHGLSPRAVADWLGHRDPAETLRSYSHLWPTDTERIRSAIDGELAGVFDGDPQE